jgi:hypothetical protein
MAEARVGISHALGGAFAYAVRIDDQVHRPLAIEGDLARAVARDRVEAHLLHHRAERLRLRGGELDELDAVDADRVRWFGELLGDGHNGVVKLS